MKVYEIVKHISGDSKDFIKFTYDDFNNKFNPNKELYELTHNEISIPCEDSYAKLVFELKEEIE